jgi:kynurenine formamidase
MRFRSFIIAYALVLAILLFADRRPRPNPQNSYSQVVDLTDGGTARGSSDRADLGTRIISPAALIPGTWAAGQIPAERLIAPLVVMDLKAASAPLSVDDIADWEARHGSVPQGAIVAIRYAGAKSPSGDQFPIAADAARFLMDARYTLGFVVENSVNLGSDRPLARQLALHGNYVVEGSARLAALPPTGSLMIVAPAKGKNAAESPVRILAMVR